MLGQIASMCLVQGGASFRVLSRPVFDYICGKELGDIIVPVNELDNVQVRDLIHKVIKP